jgi:predicted HTH domain antitoxin
MKFRQLKIINIKKMSTLNLKIPPSLQVSEFDLVMTLASKLYEEGKLSSGQGAEMAGVSKKAFLELLGKYNVSVFGYTAEELKDDLKNV